MTFSTNIVPVSEHQVFAQEITLPYAPNSLTWSVNVATTSFITITSVATTLIIEGKIVDAFTNKQFNFVDNAGATSSVTSFEKIPSSIYKAVQLVPDMNLNTSITYNITTDVGSSITLQQNIENNWSYDRNRLIDNFIRRGVLDDTSSKSWYLNVQLPDAPEASLEANAVHGTETFTSNGIFTVPGGVYALEISYLTTTGTATQIIQTRPNIEFTLAIGDYGQTSNIYDAFNTNIVTSIWSGVRIFTFNGAIDIRDYFSFTAVTTSTLTYAGTAQRPAHIANAAAQGINLNEFNETNQGDFTSTIRVDTVSSAVVNTTFDSLEAYGVYISGRNRADIFQQPLSVTPTAANGFAVAFSPNDGDYSNSGYNYNVFLRQKIAITVTY